MRLGESRFTLLYLTVLAHACRDRISTGCLTVDGILGGGIPRGRIIEVFGPESSGKTTLALSIMAQVRPPDIVLL